MNKTFKLSDINEEIISKVIFARKRASSGLGGPGCMILILEDNREYYIGYDGFSYDKEMKINELKILDLIPLFETQGKYDTDIHRYRYKLEEKGFTYVDGLFKGLLRNDYLDKYKSLVSKKSDWFRYLVSDKGTDRYEYEGSFIAWEMDKKREEEYLNSLIDESYLDWKILYPNNAYNSYSDGKDIYCLLFKKDEEYGIIGNRYTIRYDRDNELYYLFLTIYEDLEGPLAYDDPKENKGHQRYGYDYHEKTFTNLDLNSDGEFLKAYKSLEEAKKGVLWFNRTRGLCNIRKTNIIKDYESKRQEMEILLHKYEPLLIYAERYKEINQIIMEYQMKENTSGGGFIISAIENKLGLSRDYISRMFSISPLDLQRRSLDYAREKVKEAREYLYGE